MAENATTTLLPVRYKNSDFLTVGRRERTPIIHIANSLMAMMYELMPSVDPNTDHVYRTGGYCVIMNHEDAGYFQFPVGLIQLGKRDKYMELSMEKARRLRQRVRGRHRREVSSWQSRDEAKNRWGGAIITGRSHDPASTRWIFSFSGLPQMADEALSVALAVYLGKMRLERALVIADISRNGYLLRMLLKMGVYDPAEARTT